MLHYKKEISLSLQFTENPYLAEYIRSFTVSFMLGIQFIIELIFSLLFYFSGMYHFIMGLSS